MPFDRIAHAQDELRVRVAVGELLPECGHRPVHGGAVAVEQGLPVDGLAAGGGTPYRIVGGMRQHLEHVIAGPEAESLERTWGRSTRQPHPNWDNVAWEDVQEEQEKGPETGQAAAVAPERPSSPQPSAHVPTAQAPRRADESHQRPEVASNGVVSGAAAGSAGGSGKEPASADHTPCVGKMGEAASVAVVPSEQALKEGAASTGSVSGHKRCHVEMTIAEEAHDLALDHSGNR